jgi:hypothetical protein
MATLEKDKTTQKDFYLKGLISMDSVSVLWKGCRKSQRIRFEILTEIGSLIQKDVLDVGCGFGDFYGYICERGINLKRFLGVDLLRPMVKIAEETYPKHAEFEVRDILKNPPKTKFDYVFASGIFALKSPNWEKYTHAMLIQMFELCTVGMGVNFLSSFTPYELDKISHYVNPTDMLKFICKNLSSKVVLRHDYKPNDFTIFVYRGKE